MRDILKRFDRTLIELINNKLKNRFFDVFFFRITDLGGAIFSTIFSIALIAIGNNNIKLIGIEALLVLGISQSIVQIVKLTSSRERPYNALENLNTFGIQLKDYSFPSGHTTASFSIATTLALNIPGIYLIVFFFAILIGISRIYLAVHYPTDVLAGILLGVATSAFVNFYLYDYIIYLGRFIGIT